MPVVTFKSKPFILTHCVDPQGIVVPVLVDILQQGLPSQLILALVRHGELHLVQKDH